MHSSAFCLLLPWTRASDNLFRARPVQHPSVFESKASSEREEDQIRLHELGSALINGL